MRVLVVEDEVKIAQTIKRGLELKGYAVDMVHDADSGFSYAVDADYDVVVLDAFLGDSSPSHLMTREAFASIARVLRPGGLLLMSFDICEAQMGMTFPEWNGRAVSMSELDELFANCPWFERGLSDVNWNVETIDDYWAWHRTTAPHHNYVTGAISVRRTEEPWVEHPAAAPRRDPSYQEFQLEMQWRFGELSRQIKGQLPKPMHTLLKRIIRG